MGEYDIPRRPVWPLVVFVLFFGSIVAFCIFAAGDSLMAGDWRGVIFWGILSLLGVNFVRNEYRLMRLKQAR